MEIVNVVEEKETEVVERKFVAQPQRDFLERYFAEKLYSLKQGLDEVYEIKPNEEGEILSKLQSLKAYWNICRTEVGEVVELFGDINPATLNPNHRKIMSMSKHFLFLLEPLDLIKEKKKDSKKCCEFADTAIKYLMSIHTCLNNDDSVSQKDKEAVAKAFLKKEQFVDAIKQRSKRVKEETGSEGCEGE